MSSINDVADALAAVCAAATGAPAHGMVDLPSLPCVMVYPDDDIGGPYYRTARGGVVDMPFVCHLLASAADLEGQARWLNDAVSPWTAISVPAAILANPTLGTAADENTGNATASMSAHVDRVTDYGFATLFDGIRVLQARVRVTVKLTRGAN